MHATRPGQSRVWAVAVLTATAVLVVTGLTDAPTEAQLLPAIGLAVLVAIAERGAALTVRTGAQSHDLTLSEAPLMIGLWSLGPTALVLSRMAGMVIGHQVLRRQEGFKTAFNVAQTGVETLLAVAAAGAIDTLGLSFGPRLVATAVAVGAIANVSGAAAMVVARWSMTGHVAGRQAVAALRTGLVPAVTSANVGAVVIALWLTSPVLIAAPIATLVVLAGAYRSYVRLVEANRSQERLLAFSQDVAGTADLPSAATALVEAAAELFDASLVAVRLHDGMPGDWIGTTPSRGARLEGLLGLREAGTTDPTAFVGDDGHETVLLDIEHGWMAVAMEHDSIDEHDRAILAMVGRHAAVVLDNALQMEVLARQAAEARHQATHDPLTGLPNRSALRAELADAVADDEPFGVLLLDLNDFKQVNDALGHHAGDRVLVRITERLSSVIEDVRMFARLGGDEFAAIVAGGVEEATATARRIHELIGREVSVDGFHVAIGSSIGVALFPDHAEDPSNLLRHADLAMYEAKGRGGGTEVYGQAAGGRAYRELLISSGFRQALDHGDLEVVFQPIVDLADQRLVAVEALTRWSHPDLGPVAPEEFIAAAEQHGMVTELTEVVLASALRWQRMWARSGVDVHVAVNMSARSLLEDDLPEMVASVLSRHGAKADRLTLELTESSLVTDPNVTVPNLHRLADLGVRLAVDDFGTGYSSLAYLRELPVDEVKVDKSFVTTMDPMGPTPAVLSGIINLCHQMGVDLVAEGIEDLAVQERLVELGCTRGQGYAIARPMDGAQLVGWQSRRAFPPAVEVVL